MVMYNIHGIWEQLSFNLFDAGQIYEKVRIYLVFMKNKVFIMVCAKVEVHTIGYLEWCIRNVSVVGSVLLLCPKAGHSTGQAGWGVLLSQACLPANDTFVHSCTERTQNSSPGRTQITHTHSG